MCIASWDWGCDPHTSQWSVRIVMCAERKKGGHKFNCYTPCCVMQQILLLIISNTCITNEETLSVCVHLMHKQFSLKSEVETVIFNCVVVHSQWVIHYCWNKSLFVDPQFLCSIQNEQLWSIAFTTSLFGSFGSWMIAVFQIHPPDIDSISYE